MTHCIILSLSTLFVPLFCADDSDNRAIYGKTFFSPKPQGNYQPRRMMGVMHQYYRPQQCRSWVTYSGLLDQAGTFKNQDIGNYLFFNHLNSMLFASNEDAFTDVFTQNFLLNNNFEGTLTITPRNTTTVIDNALFFGFDSFLPDWYLFIELPWCTTRWNLKKSTTTQSVGTTIPADSLGNSSAQPAPTTSLFDAVNGQFTFFDVQEPLHFARMDESHSQSGLADIRLSIGTSFVNREDRHFGLSARCIIPTGNRPNGEFLFEPVVGNGHHFQLGFGLSAHDQVWNFGDLWLNGYLEGSLYHVFKAQQRRSFDLKANGIGSRYLLLKEFSNNVYTGRIVRGPNVLTLSCKVSNAIDAQATGMFELGYNDWIAQVGYNVWGRSQDQISDIELFAENTYGIAGLSGTGTDRDRTASLTTIRGENATNLDTTNVYLKNSDIDVQSAEHPIVFTNLVFAYLGYHPQCCAYDPFAGIALEVELSGHHNRAFNMWHIIVKAGFSL